MKEKVKKIGLVGNPNVGKSTVFNALTGLKQHTGNWTGKTVTNAVGNFEYEGKEYELVDLPGTYSLISHSAEEEVTRDYVLKKDYDLIVIVCDAVCLERNLNLVLQVKKITKDILVCVNLLDEARKKKIRIDLIELEKELGVSIVGISARNEEGLDKLLEKIKANTREERILSNLVIKEKEEMLNDIQNEKKINIEEIISIEVEKEIIKDAELISKRVVKFEKENYASKDRKIDKILTNKITGIPIMLLMLGIILWLTIEGANYPSQFLFDVLFNIGDKIEIFLTEVGAPIVLIDMLINGMYKVLAWVVAVMLPPMAIFFPLFTLLEDLGVLPRIAFNLDGIFKKCHACGKQALTMCMGFGCNACGVTGCRIIDSPRERLIAILTNNFIPCNGRFPTLISIITMFFVGANAGAFSSIKGVIILLALIVFGIMMTFIVSKILSKTVLKGKSSSFILELPPYRKPQIGKVIVRSILDRTLFVLGRAVSVAAPAGILIWCLTNFEIDNISIITYVINFLEPFARTIGLDGIILTAFILGFPANEIVMPIILMLYMSSGELVEMDNLISLKEVLLLNGWTVKTAICVMLFSILHWPCSTTCLTIKKETGSLKWTFAGFLIPTTIAIIVCFTVNLVGELVF
ncbi:MAG: ferrous iron transport protein B [Clostridia bacterium]|nr:ferrous iron transport protein B [Clostridia bacterium]